MKQLRIITIVTLLFFAGTSLYSQEVSDDTGDAVKTEENLSKNDSSVKAEDTLPATGTVEDAISAGDNKAVSSEEKKSAVSEDSAEKVIKKVPGKKSGVSKKKEAKTAAKPAPSANSYDHSNLLKVEDGNFKYRRIPGIELEDRNSSSIEPAVSEKLPEEEKPGGVEEEENGFFGLGKTAADLVAKGGIIILILLIFILYRKRTKGSRKKGTKRNVLNSYRK